MLHHSSVPHPFMVSAKIKLSITSTPIRNITMHASAPETIEQFLDAEPITELNDSANLMSDRAW